MRRGDIKRRADVNFAANSIILQNAYSKPNFPLTALGDVESYIQYGISALASDDPSGIPILRMNNLQDDDWDFSDLKYIQLSEDETRRYELRTGDILFNRTNSKELVGKCAVFREEGRWVFASYLIRLRLDESRALPEFVSSFLNTQAGRIQIDRISRQIIGMSNINAEEIRKLIIPLPQSIEKQYALVSELERGRKEGVGKLDQANTLLSGVDDFLLNQIGLAIPNCKHKTTYAVTLSQPKSAKRLNADYFHPERMAAIKAVENCRGANRVAYLYEVADFIRNLQKTTNSTEYVGLANVQSNSGELVKPNGGDVEGQCFRFEVGDLLFARLRPYLNKVYRAERAGVCSTEFHVIRVRPGRKTEEAVLPDYLAAVLRSSAVVAQTTHMMTGNTHPRLANDDVLNLIIPVPIPKIQQLVVEELSRRREEARRLRREATKEWEEAKVNFERQLLGGPS